MTRTQALALGLTVALTACDASDHRAVLGGAIELSAAVPDSNAESVRRVWARAGDYASPSPDGRHITFVDWSTGDVAMHDLSTGEDRRLTDKGAWTDDGSWAEEPRFSPDGRQVAYSYGNTRVPDAAYQYELRVVTVGDTTQRVLLALTPRDNWIVATDWSASQGILVEINRGDDRDFATDVAVVDPENGAVRVLRSFTRDDVQPHDGAFSPDGRFVAYRQGKALHVMAVDGSRDETLDMDVRWVLGWAPDGGGVLVHASARSTTGIWSIPVTDGRRTGEPALVRGGLAAFMPGGFAGQTYYYRVPVDAPTVFTVSIDVPAGRVLSPPTAITSPLDGVALRAAWSPDGRSLAYALRDDAERVTRLMLRATDGDEVRELATMPEGRVLQVLWSPDGRSLLVHAETRQGPTVYRANIVTGEVREAYAHHGQGIAVAPDGRLVYVRGLPNRPDLASGLFVRDLATGEERRLVADVAATRALGVSPDGRYVALVLARDEAGVTRVGLVPMDGGPMREVARADHPTYYPHNVVAGSLNWTPDGRYLLLNRGTWEGGNYEIVAVPVAGGQPIHLMRSAGQRGHALHPAGRRLAYVGGEPRHEMWVLDDLTPQGR